MPKELLVPVACIATPIIFILSVKIYQWLTPGTLPPFDADAFIESTVQWADEQEDNRRINRFFKGDER